MTRTMIQVLRWAALLLAALVSACATTTGGDSTPVPVEERRPLSEPVPPPLARAQIPETAPARPPSPAVEALLAQALSASRNGDPAGAVSLLERAQRIEPRNALVWNRLALARLQQAQYAQAESLAQKSNLYAGGDAELRVRNWRLIAEARRKQGDTAGARDAERKAQTIGAGP